MSDGGRDRDRTCDPYDCQRSALPLSYAPELPGEGIASAPGYTGSWREAQAAKISYFPLRGACANWSRSHLRRERNRPHSYAITISFRLLQWIISAGIPQHGQARGKPARLPNSADFPGPAPGKSASWSEDSAMSDKDQIPRSRRARRSDDFSGPAPAFRPTAEPKPQPDAPPAHSKTQRGRRRSTRILPYPGPVSPGARLTTTPIRFCGQRPPPRQPVAPGQNLSAPNDNPILRAAGPQLLLLGPFADCASPGPSSRADRANRLGDRDMRSRHEKRRRRAGRRHRRQIRPMRNRRRGSGRSSGRRRR